VFGSGEDIRSDDGLKQACELGISEMNAIERLEVLAKVVLQRGAVTDVRAIGVLELSQFSGPARYGFLLWSLLFILGVHPWKRGYTGKSTQSMEYTMR